MKVTIDGQTHEIDESAIDFEDKVLVDLKIHQQVYLTKMV